MKKSLDDHAERFSECAAEYDDSQDAPEYRTAADLVVGHANPSSTDTVLDLGTGTGAIAFGLAGDAGRVIGRDISEGMLEQAVEKADGREVGAVEFGVGRFREPNVPEGADVDIVTSNFAMHHLGDGEKREAIAVIAGLTPRRIVLGDVMFFGNPDPAEPFYSPEVDDPATVGVLADAFTDSGYALTAVEMVADQVGVLVGERVDRGT
jgi:SAM-dependent methyltransferase